jgi:hypothetical protein
MVAQMLAFASPPAAPRPVREPSSRPVCTMGARSSNASSAPTSESSSSRRAFLASLALSAAGALLLNARPSSAGIQTTMSDGGYADPADVSALAEKAGGASVDIKTFRKMLDKGEVLRVFWRAQRDLLLRERWREDSYVL